MTWEHGASAYSKSRCRCPVCTTANSERIARQLAERMAARKLVDGVLVASGVRHGTSNAYRNWGCRCEPCSTFHKRDMRRYRARRKAGWAAAESPET